MPILYRKRTQEEATNSLAAYLPGGPLFQSAHCAGTNIRRFLEGLALQVIEAEENVNLVASEYDIKTTTLFIEEWEGFVGIPDSCFSGTGSLQQRRIDVLTKLTALGIQTAQDYVDLAATFGVEIEVFPGTVAGAFPLTFPAILFDTEKDAHFTIVINFSVEEASRFTFTFPFLFGSSEIATLQCLFEKLRPANCDLIFNQV